MSIWARNLVSPSFAVSAEKAVWQRRRTINDLDREEHWRTSRRRTAVLRGCEGPSMAIRPSLLDLHHQTMGD